MYSVVMAGGSGTRFWPASRRSLPKQLLALTGDRSLIQQTVDRVSPLTPPARVLVVTGAAHAAAVAQQLPDLPAGQVLAEPQGRNTAAACALAAAWLVKEDPDAVCLVLPADHLITDEAAYLRTLERAATLAAREDVLVTLGLTPRFPATGYGYIEAAEVVDKAEPPILRVEAFHEKPDLETAQDYVASGHHFWNSGMFVWRAAVLLAEISAHMPDLAEGIAEISPHLGTARQDEVLARVYPELPNTSIDYGVLEHSGDLRVVKADFGWSDVGSWEAMADLWPADRAGNVSHSGRVVAIESEGNVISAGGRLTALLGVNDLVTVVTDDVLLVMPRERSQDLKRIITRLQEDGLKEYL